MMTAKELKDMLDRVTANMSHEELKANNEKLVNLLKEKTKDATPNDLRALRNDFGHLIRANYSPSKIEDFVTNYSVITNTKAVVAMDVGDHIHVKVNADGKFLLLLVAKLVLTISKDGDIPLEKVGKELNRLVMAML